MFLLGVGNIIDSRSSWSTNELGVKGDLIYYIAEDRGLYIYDLENETVSFDALRGVTQRSKLAFWLMPSIRTHIHSSVGGRSY